MPITVPTYADFIECYPVFASLSQTVIEKWLSVSGRLLDADAWGDFYSDAVMLDTAHTLSINQMTGAALNGGQQAATGPISSSSAAGISVSFASPDQIAGSKSDSWYNKTAYGQQFLRLRNIIIPAACLTA